MTYNALPSPADPARITWSWDDNQAAFYEGWGVFENTTHGTTIERLDDPPSTGIKRLADCASPFFPSDEAALDWVQRHADAGSDFHSRALAYVEQEKAS